MPHPHLTTGSPWISTIAPPFNPLLTSTTADCCVVGAGIAGLSVAYELAALGRSVVVIDEHAMGLGQTCNTTAHLVTALDERYFELERIQGPMGAAMARESHAAAIDRIESISREERIACRFARLDGYVFVPPENDRAADLIQRELDAATRAGAEAHPLARTPALGVAAPCLRFPYQAQLQPLLYLGGLASAIRARGGRIFAGTRAATIRGGAFPCVITAENLRISCSSIVVATNTPIRERTETLPSQTAFRSYVLAMEIDPDLVTPALYWDGYWDDDTPYHYVRFAASDPLHAGAPYDQLIVGGEDHEDGEEPADAAARYGRLERWSRSHFPGVGDVTHRWNGRILEPDDELAYIGRHPEGQENVYVISGDSGNGMTYAAIAGMLIPGLMQHRTHPWEALYSPTRGAAQTPCRRALARCGAAYPASTIDVRPPLAASARPATG